jgi:malate dehydrogenase (NAD) (EC 1.1.1.37)
VFHYPHFYQKEKLDEIVQNTKQVAAKVIELKGATVHAPGNAISAIIETVVRDRKQVIPVATYLDGEYGHSDVTIGVPDSYWKERNRKNY